MSDRLKIRELEQKVYLLIRTMRGTIRTLKDVYDVYYYDTDNETEKDLFDDIEDVWDESVESLLEVVPKTDYVDSVLKELQSDFDMSTHSIYLPRRSDRKWYKINDKNEVELVDKQFSDVLSD